MNGAAAGVVAGTVGTVVAGVLVSLLTRETEGWINAVPVWLLRLARRRVPSSHRDILWSEWSAELHAALHSTEDRPVTRLLLGTRYALGLVLTARKIADELGPARAPAEGPTAGEQAHEASSRSPGWWRDYADLPSWFSSYLGLEETASCIRSYEAQCVPSLLQTPAYARALIATTRAGASAQDIEQRVDLRLSRQHQLLGSPCPPRLWAVVDEAALRRQIGGREVMRAQIRHLIELAAQPHITLQVVPWRSSGHLFAGGPFTILRFAELGQPDVVYIEHLTSALCMDQREHVEHYMQTMDKLCVIAEPSDRTLEILNRIHHDL